MKEYDIIITEVSRKTATVKARSKEEAMEMVRHRYYDSEIILTEHDFQDVSFDYGLKR